MTLYNYINLKGGKSIWALEIWTKVRAHKTNVMWILLGHYNIIIYSDDIAWGVQTPARFCEC